MIAKIKTAARLAVAGEWTIIRRQWAINTARQRLRRHGGRPFVHSDPGFRFICHPDWPDSVDQFLNNAGDHWEFALLRSWLRDGDTVFDIGANLGLYSCAAFDAVKKTGTVIAVDADPYAVRKLEVSARLLDGASFICVHAAVSDRDGSLNFFVRREHTITGEQSLCPAPEQMKTSQKVTVPACSLNSLQQRYASKLIPSLVKLDIEGAEAGALAAAPGAWLTGEGPLWIVEINPGALARFGATPSEIVCRFPIEAFDVQLLSKHPLREDVKAEVRPLRPDEEFADSLYYNLLAIPKGKHWRDRYSGVRAFLPMVSQ
jgi:FkbM family methyltransferase